MICSQALSIGFTPSFPGASWVPSVLGIAGTLVLFFGCMLLINETRLALQALKSETAFTLALSRRYQEQYDTPGKADALASLEHMSEEVRRGFPRTQGG